MANDHNIAACPPCAQDPKLSKRRRYGADFVGPRPLGGRPKAVGLAVKSASPLRVTRGDKIQLTATSPQNALKCIVDFLTFSVQADRLSTPMRLDIGSPFCPGHDTQYIHDTKGHSMEATSFESFFDCLLPEFQTGSMVVSKTASFDYCRHAFRASYVDRDTGELVHFATIGLHVDNAKRVRWVFLVSGHQCRMFDMAALSQYLIGNQANISRLDLAVDDYEGNRSVGYFLDLYKTDQFKARGHSPKPRYIDDLGSGEGKTLYLGKRENGKQLCIYEKGRHMKKGQDEALTKLQGQHPNWVRTELRLGNRDRVIPLDALVKPAAYFLGSYPVFSSAFPDLESATVEQIRTHSAKLSAVDTEHFWDCVSTSYGAGVSWMRAKGATDSEIVDRMARKGIQKCLGTPDADAVRASLN